MRKKILKDRSDGYYLTQLNPFSRLIPFIMPERTDAHVFFKESIDLTRVEPFLKMYRDTYKVKIGMMHLIVAAMVRTMSQKPKINRFVAGKKLYARKEVAISFSMKKAMTEKAGDAAVKISYDPKATIHDIVKIINKEVAENKAEMADNKADHMTKVIGTLPNFVISLFFVGVKWADGLGILPSFLLEASPFHTSIFMTNLGSLGIEAVYHHIYNIGTTSLFIAFGKKRLEKKITKDGEVVKTMMDLKVVADERIVDGFYYATAFKLFIRYLEHPERLLEPPKVVVIDSEI